jgi:hypothetical protein
MKKTILCLVVAMAMVVGASFTTYAEEIQGSKSWLVDFDGNNMNSNFKSSELTEEILNAIEPGDSIALQVTIKNSSDGTTDWYMTNEVLETLEESQSEANGGAYTYYLSYTDASGVETVLYNSEDVGGDDTSGGEGLHQATNSTKDYFYLDRLEAGKSGAVHLIVSLDGETQGNDYQNTLAKLQMNFAVEKVTTTVSATPSSDKPSTGTSAQPGKSAASTVKTGDPSQILLFCALLMLSGVVLLIFGLKALNRRKDDNEEVQ